MKNTNGTPEIVNTDHSGQFKSQDWIDVFIKANVRISIDDRGLYFDKIFFEQL